MLTSHKHIGEPHDECQRCGLPRTNRHHVGEEPVLRPTAPAPLDGARPRVGLRHPETSKQAAQKAVPQFGSRRRFLLDAIAAAGALGRTDDELEMETTWAHQSVSASRNSLVADGWLMPLFQNGQRVTRATRTGSAAQVWVVTEAGRLAWASR